MSFTSIVNSAYSVYGTCRSKVSVKWHWLKIFLIQIFLHFGQFFFLQQTSL